MKRFVSVCLAAAVFFAMQTAAAADFFLYGGFSDTTVPFGFDTSLALTVYNQEVEPDPDYDELFPGTAIYIPVVKDDGGTTFPQATEKDIKDNKVTVSYKATRGGQHVKSVTIVEGKKEKIKDLPSGAYAKIQLAESFSGSGSAKIEARLVLSINKSSYRDTEIGLEGIIKNNTVYVDENTIYGAQLPALFEASASYSGEATFDMGGGVEYTGYVRARQKYLINYTSEPDDNISAMYPDAYLEFHRFLDSNTAFERTGSLEIPIDRSSFISDNGQPRVFAYRISGDSLVALDSGAASFDSKNNILTIKTKTLDEYVLSNQSLLREIVAQDENDATFQSGYATEVPQASSSASASPSAIPQPVNMSASSTANIYASNTDTQNPITGGGHFPLIPSLMILPSGWICLSALLKRRRK